MIIIISVLVIVLSFLSVGLCATESLDADASALACEMPAVTISMTGESAKEYAASLGVENYDEVEGIYFSTDVRVSAGDEAAKCYFGNDYYIDDDSISTSYGVGNIIKYSIYQGAATATMTVNQTLNGTFTFDFTIDAEILQASLGYTTAYTYTISDSYTVTIPDGVSYALQCWTYVQTKTFDVWEDDLFFDDYVGEYSSTIPIGYFFIYFAV